MKAKKKEEKKKALSWRERGFLDPTENLIIFPGTAIFSPAWFSLGHDVISLPNSSDID
jgi:hypothetical protein